MPVILTDPGACSSTEGEDISQDRRQKKTIFYRFKPTYEVRKFVLLASSTPINCVDDSRQINIKYRSYHPVLLRRRGGPLIMYFLRPSPLPLDALNYAEKVLVETWVSRNLRMKCCT